MDGIDAGRRTFLMAASSLGYVALVEGLQGVARADDAGLALAPQNAPAAQRTATQRPGVLVFDVNQTLLDTDALRPAFARASATARRWMNGFRCSCNIPWSYRLPIAIRTLAPSVEGHWKCSPRPKACNWPPRTRRGFCRECSHCPRIRRCPPAWSAYARQGSAWSL